MGKDNVSRKCVREIAGHQEFVGSRPSHVSEKFDKRIFDSTPVAKCVSTCASAHVLLLMGDRDAARVRLEDARAELDEIPELAFARLTWEPSA